MTTATPSNTPKQENRVVFGMFLAGAAVYVQTYDAQAILPQIGNDLVTSPTKTVLILSATTIGMAISVLPWAYISDRTGRLNTIRFSLVIAALMSIVNPFIPQFIPILAIRLFKGLFLGGVTGLAVTFLFEQLPMIRAVIASGIYISGNTIGGVSTRILSAILEQHIGWRFTLELLAATSLVLAISFVAITHNITDDKSGSDSESTKGLINELWQSRVLLVFLQGFVTLGTFNALFSLLPFRIHDTAPHFATVLTTMVLGLYVLAFIPSQLGGRIAGRIGIHRVLAIGYSLAFVGLALLFADGIAALIAGVSAFIIGAFFVHPLSSAESGRRAPKHRAQSTALYQIGWLTGATLISPLATTIYDVAGWTASVALLIATLFCGALGAIAGRRFEGI